MYQVRDQVTAAVEFPQKGEIITSKEYAFRIAAPVDARLVEVCIDGGEFGSCRLSEGRWWFDWSNYTPGYHTAVVRITLRDGYVFQLSAQEMQVELGSAARKPSAQQTACQVSVTVTDEPGVLAKLTQILAKEGVDLQGMVTERLGGATAIRFVTMREAGLRRKLERAGFPVLENEVFHLEMPNRPAEFNRLAKTLAEEGINIVSFYSVAQGGRARCMVTVDQPELAERAITRNGFQVIEAE